MKDDELELTLDFDTLNRVMDDMLLLLEEIARKMRVYDHDPEMKAWYRAKYDAIDTVIAHLDYLREDSLTPEHLEWAEKVWRGES